MKLTIADLVDTEMFPCVNEAILVKLMKEIGDHLIDVEAIRSTVEKRRTCVFYDEVAASLSEQLRRENIRIKMKGGGRTAAFHSLHCWRRKSVLYFSSNRGIRTKRKTGI